MAVFGSVLGQVVEPVCCMNEGFRWNATADQAGASGFFTLYDDGFEAKLACTDCSDIATRASADDENLTLFCLHINQASHEDGCWVLEVGFDQLNQTCAIVSIDHSVVPR